MPWFIPVATAAVALAGTGLQMSAAADQRDAQDKALSAEMLRQQRYGKQGRGVFNASLAKSGRKTAEEQISSGEQRARSQYEKYQDVQLSNTQLASSPTLDKTVSDAVGKGKNTLANTAAARMQGYSEWDLQQMIKNMRAQQELAIIGRNSQNSANLLNGDLMQASQAGGTAAGVGSLASAAAGALGTYYAQKGPTGGTRPIASYEDWGT